MYKDLAKRRKANKIRQQRFRDKKKGVMQMPISSEINNAQNAPQSTKSVTPDHNIPQNVTPITPLESNPVRPDIVITCAPEVWDELMGATDMCDPGVKCDTVIPKVDKRLEKMYDEAQSQVKLSPHRSMSIPAICADGVEPRCRLINEH